MATVRLTTGQAVVNYLANQYVERDGVENRFFAGLWGIFGHGNIGGIAQASSSTDADFPLLPAAQRAGDGPRRRRLREAQATGSGAFACLSSIGPGATNMVTGAASATINHVPGAAPRGRHVRRARPVPRSSSSSSAAASQDTSASTTRSARSSATGTASIAPSRSSPRCPRSCASSPRPPTPARCSSALPQDVQTYAFDFPVEMFAKRVWSIPRNRPDRASWRRPRDWIRAEQAPGHLRRRRRALQRGDRGPARLRRADGHPGRRDARRQGLPALRPPAEPRRGGRLGDAWPPTSSRPRPTSSSASARASRTSRPRRRRRSRTRTSGSSTSTSPSSTPSSTPRCRSSATRARRSRSWPSPSATSRRRAEYRARVLELNRAWDAEVERVYAHSVGDVLTPGRGHRRGRGLGRPARRGGHVRGQPAGRPAQALAVPRPGAATRWSTATRRWATRSPAAWAPSWPRPTARSTSWSATARS